MWERLPAAIYFLTMSNPSERTIGQKMEDWSPVLFCRNFVFPLIDIKIYINEFLADINIGSDVSGDFVRLHLATHQRQQRYQIIRQMVIYHRIGIENIQQISGSLRPDLLRRFPSFTQGVAAGICFLIFIYGPKGNHGTV